MPSRRKSRSRRVKRSSRKSSKIVKQSSGKTKLVSIKKSPIKGKKLRATFSDGTHTDFGFAGMSDYTKHKDPQRMQRYLNRHRSRENWNNYKSRGSLSRYILWNKPSLQASISDYKRRFNL
jgi:CDGSH-type Zn-finger protein